MNDPAKTSEALPRNPDGPGAATREKILRRAEELFAAEGIDRVTLRQIARAADQRNVAAVQYHFGSKDGLLRAMIERHQREVDDARSGGLASLGREARLGALLHVLVDPLAAKLDDASGRAYLQIQTQRRDPDPLLPATRELATRIEAAIGPHGVDPVRNHFVVLLLFHALAERARAETSGRPIEPGRERFVTELIDALHGIYSTPPSKS